MKKTIQASCLLAALLAAGGASSKNVDRPKPAVSAMSTEASAAAQLREQALAAEEKNNWQGAASFWKELLALLPGNGDVCLKLAEAQLLAAEQEILGTPIQQRAYEAAIDSYRQALPLLRGERLARSYAGLAQALHSVGRRERGTVRLSEAAAAYREALKTYSAQHHRLDWASTQSGLGAALAQLSERNGGDTAHLAQAIEAFRAALTVYVRDQMPQEWAMTQNNLGNVLRSLGQREGGTEKLKEAVAAYQEVLQGSTQQRDPMQWAATQNNLGNALKVLGQREGSVQKLNDAVSAYREALKERTREQAPLDWASTQNNLGTVLKVLGEQDISAAGLPFLRDARAAYEQALAVYQNAGAAHYADIVQRNLDNLLVLISRRGG